MMIINAILGAILQKALRITPEQVLRAAIVLAAIVGVLSSLAIPIFIQLTELLPRSRVRKQHELNVELQRKYEGICAQLVEERQARETLQKENVELRRLNEERLGFDRYHDSRTRAAMKGKDQ